MLHSSKQVRMGVTAVIVIGALLMIFVVPFIAFDMVNPIVGYQQERIAKFMAESNPSAPLLVLTTWLVSFFYPFWGSMSLIAGLTLLVIIMPLYRGETWTRGLALLCLAVPSMGGAYMIVPWMNFVGTVEGGFPPAVFIMSVGLIPYFTLLLADKGDITQKVVDFFVFLMLGVCSAEAFANGHAAFRILYGHPSRPQFGPNIAITFFGWLGLWVSAALTISAIYLLATRKMAGWYTAVIGGLIAFVVSGATHYVRHVTLDYLYGSLMGLSIVVMLVIPVVKTRLLNKYTADSEAQQEANLQPTAA
ncbi:MAG: hypothetical protein DWQ04_22565 [Chloroflexi bacterium]|nr:MAG: hypothetical protein DWQ04_22565 [Chloroflexota bacterium]